MLAKRVYVLLGVFLIGLLLAVVYITGNLPEFGKARTTVSFSGISQVGGYHLKVKDSLILDRYFSENGLLEKLKTGITSLDEVRNVQIVLTKEKQRWFPIMTGEGWEQQSSGYSYENDSKTLQIIQYYDKRVLDEIIKNYSVSRVDRDVLTSLCLFTKREVTSAEINFCHNLANSFYNKQFGRHLFELSKNDKTSWKLVKPVFAALGCAYGMPASDYVCGNTVTNCTCSVSGTCSYPGEICGYSYVFPKGTCSCSSSCVDNNYSAGTHHCENSSCSNSCPPGECLVAGKGCPAQVTCGGCGNYGNCFLSGGSCIKAGTPSCKGDTSPCYASCSASACCSPVNGGWTNWSPASCSSSCGQSQTRSCTSPSPSCGGADCSDGSSQSCGSNDATVPGQVTLVSPVGTLANPTVVTQPFTATFNNTETNHGYTDYYEYQIYDQTAQTWIVGNGTNGLNAGGPTTTTIGIDGLTTGHIYYWQVRAVNNSCSGLPAGVAYGQWSSSGYFRVNTPPILSAFRQYNVTSPANVRVMPEMNGGRGYSHICRLEFADSGNPRKVSYWVGLYDGDGYGDIASAQLRWNRGGASKVYDLVLQAGSASFPNNLVGLVDVDYAAADNGSGVYPLEVNVIDKQGASSGWTDTNWSWKVWDCNVATAGTVFDGSPVITSSSVSYSNPAPVSMNFASLVFSSSGVNYPMTVVKPADYSGSLKWGRNYFINFNSDLAASDMHYRFQNTTYNSLAMIDYSQANIDAYQNVSPTVDLDFSFIRDQEGWYQVKGSGTRSRLGISSAVPLTCSLPSCTPSLVVNNIGISDDGLVASPNYSITSGCTTCLHSYPRDNYLNQNIMLHKHSYQEIKNSYWGKYGLGTTLVGDKTLADVVTSLAGGTGVAFVDGNLNVTGNNSLTSSQFLGVIVSGDIVIDQSVTNVAGVFLANGNISIGGTNSTLLTVEGVLYSSKNISITRTYSTKINNNTMPATVFKYRPDFVFTMPAQLSQAVSLKY